MPELLKKTEEEAMLESYAFHYSRKKEKIEKWNNKKMEKSRRRQQSFYSSLLRHLLLN
jgi:hypothetical protein